MGVANSIRSFKLVRESLSIDMIHILFRERNMLRNI